jgi:hypothetical protein
MSIWRSLDSQVNNSLGCSELRVLQVGKDLEVLGSTTKDIESTNSVLASSDTVESCWLSNCQDVQADSAMGSPEEIEPEAEVF